MFDVGFVLRATVTRHQFGHIQSRLFPVFFRVGTIATLVSIGCFAVAHPLTAVSPTEQMQVLKCLENMPLTIVLEGCISQYTRLLYWRDASHNTLDYCIGGMHLTIH